MDNKEEGYIEMPIALLEAECRHTGLQHTSRIRNAITLEHWKTHGDMYYRGPVEITASRLMELTAIAPVSSIYRAVRKLVESGTVIKHETQTGRTAYELRW